MEEYSIIALPEIREMVVRHLESKDLEEIALVSPAFYQIVCRIDQDVLKLDEKVSFFSFCCISVTVLRHFIVDLEQQYL